MIAPPPSTRRLVEGAAATAGGFVVLFVVLGLAVQAGDTLAVDRTIILAVHAWSSPALTVTLQAITELGALAVAGPFAVLEAFVFYRSGQRVAAVALVLAVGLNPLLVDQVKLAFARPRPELFPSLVSALGYSYPSGHAALATVTYGFSAVLVGPRLRSRGARLGLALGTALVVALVCLSRVYLGVHYPSDVVGGVFLGAAWVSSWWGALQLLE